MVPIENENERKVYENIYRSIFNHPPYRDNRFLNKSWSEFLLPDVFLGGGTQENNDELNALLNCIGKNEGAIIASDCERDPLLSQGYIFSVHSDSFSELSLEPEITHFEYVLFSESRRWGVYCSTEDFSAVSGDSEFINCFAEYLGGKEKLIDDFLAFCKTGWTWVPEWFKKSVLQSWNVDKRFNGKVEDAIQYLSSMQ